MSAAWCGIRYTRVSYIRIDVFLANVNNSHWDITQLFRLLSQLMRRIAPSRNEILTCSRHQFTLLAISLMKDYLFIAIVSRRRVHRRALFAKCQRAFVVGIASDVRNDGMRANCLSEIFNSRTMRNDCVNERIIQFSNTVLYFPSVVIKR